MYFVEYLLYHDSVPGVIGYAAEVWGMNAVFT